MSSTKLGLVGLPNVGKSTLFNALTTGHAAVAPYPFTTIDQNVGVAVVTDPRLATLQGLLKPEKVIPTSLEFVDIAGLVKGANKGEGLGNQFLSHVFGVDALLHVVRAFADENVAHSMGAVDPLRDIEVINTELMLKDLEVLGRRKDKEHKLAKGGDKAAMHFIEQLDTWHAALEKGTMVRNLAIEPHLTPKKFGVDLLTAKPVLYAVNVGESSDAATDASLAQVRALAQREGSRVVTFSAKLEAELAELDPNDRAEMMRELGVKESALPTVIREGYALLKLITFFTTASKILQAWTVPQGTKAPQAAGVIHTDFEKNFIRAEVVQAGELVTLGGEAQARAQGKLRLEGKEYAVQDGDVIHFKIGA